MARNQARSDSAVFGREQSGKDLELDLTLRPRRFDEFVGQKGIKESLRIYIQAAQQRKEPLDHLLFSGPPGLGKTTLAYIVATEMGAQIKPTSGPVLEKAGDLAGILTNLERGDVLFVDEIHRISKIVEEYLYSAMEDFAIDILLDQGANARSVRIDLKRFTLIGSTTREGLLSGPMRSRFGIAEKLEFYPWEDLAQIIRNSARILKVKIDAKGCEAIARRARGTPRVANRLLSRIRDFAQVKAGNVIGESVALDGLKMLGIDEHGLCAMDRRILNCIMRQGGAPVGLKNVAVTVDETEDTIEDVYEPFLIQAGYIVRTPRGRMATDAAYRALGVAAPSPQQRGLFGNP
jgi:Holliday junction DNA helicase RuvB